MKKRVLITGAAGFLGSFLSEELVSHGHFVLGVDNFFRGKESNTSSLKDQNFILEECDLTHDKEIPYLKKLISQHKIETVFHLAAVNGTQYFYDRPLFVFDQNIKITQNLLSSISNTEVKAIIYASSSEVYGDPILIPTNENHPINLNINADRDSYAASKAIGEFYIRLYAKKHHLSSLILRVFNLYGERMVGTKYGQVIPEFIHRLLHHEKFTIIGNSMSTRSFCYIEDATSAMRMLMEKNIEGVVNVGNDKEIKILELAKSIHNLEHIEFNPTFLPARANDHQRRKPDILLLKTILPGLVFTNLTSGLEKTIAYYKRAMD